MPDIVQGADSRMIQRRNRASLAVEAFFQLGLRGEMLRQDFDRYFAPQPRVTRAIYLAHAARAKKRLGFIWAELCAGGECHEERRIIPPRRSQRHARNLEVDAAPSTA